MTDSINWPTFYPKFSFLKEADVSSLCAVRQEELSVAKILKVAEKTFFFSATLALESVLFVSETLQGAVCLPVSLAALAGVIIFPKDSGGWFASGYVWKATPGISNVVTGAFKTIVCAFFCIATPFAVLLVPKLIPHTYQVCSKALPLRAPPKEVKTLDKKVIPFSQLKGISVEIERDLKKLINRVKNPERAKALGLKMPSVLLYGPPGCGKTTFAESIAEELGADYRMFKISEMGSTYLHGTSINILAKITPYIEKAKKGEKVVLCFDELDMNTINRSATHTSSTAHEGLTQELGAIMSIIDDAKNAGVLVFAATNQAKALDPALLRRFGQKIKVTVPSIEQLQDALNELKKQPFVAPDADFKDVFQGMEASEFTFSDLTEIIERANGEIFEGGDVTRELLLTQIQKYAEEKKILEKERVGEKIPDSQKLALLQALSAGLATEKKATE